ncbi:MAG: MFS transporter [Actinomycetaceae bacterium]|nr:MFS transporter [Actinomycetaceae bacterium]
MEFSENRVVSRARFATAVFFFTNGAVMANLLPRLPELKRGFSLADDTYGVVVAAVPAGAILAGLSAGWFARRFGVSVVAAVGTAVTAGALLLASLVPAVGLLVVCLALAGAADAVVDVAQNSHGLEVQRLYGRSIINGFHAVWSIGAVCGGLMAASAVLLGVPLPWHLAVSGVLFAGLALWAQRGCLPRSACSTSSGEASSSLGLAPMGGRGRLVTYSVLATLVLVAVAGAMVEDLANSWATLFLERDLQAPRFVSVLGFPVIVGAQFVGRLAGDSMVDRWGYRGVARFGAGLIAVGLGLVVAWPLVPVTLVGFAAAGFGSATLVPAAMHAADGLPYLRPGVGLTVVSWLMRLGFMLTAPMVGAIADLWSLRMGLGLVAVAGLVAVFLAGVLPGRDTK